MNSVILLQSGVRFNLADPDPDLINIEDIAHALAYIPRFNGQTRVPYSVASHSLYCSHVVSDRHALQALMHDAAEAYVGDMTSPLKRLLPEFKKIEDRIQAAICRKYEIPFRLHEEVKWADVAAYCVERSDAALFETTRSDRSFSEDPEVSQFDGTDTPTRELIVGQAPLDVKRNFLERFELLMGARVVKSGRLLRESSD